MNSPTFILEKEKLLHNLSIFDNLRNQTNIILLYTIKAFNKKDGLDIISRHFDGFSIGNINEYAKVSSYTNKHLHTYSPAYYPDEIEILAKQSSTMSFNSIHQWKTYAHTCAKNTSIGLRINPHLSLIQPKYCDSNQSRLGIGFQDFIRYYNNDNRLFSTLEGLHFHALCHQDFPALEKLFLHIETYYSDILPTLKWLNLGGGQNFTHKSYNDKAFIILIQQFQKKYPHLTLYFEPGNAVVDTSGYFKCTILDIIDADIPIVILDTSIETHLLDIAITKQVPTVRHTSENKTPYRYQLTGLSCIAGDVIGHYYFNHALHIGDEIIFENMLGYTLTKQTTFNGLKKVGFEII